MNKLALTLLFILFLSCTAFAQTDCDVWLGTWDVLTEDNETQVWEIDRIVTGVYGSVKCQAFGEKTLSSGGEGHFMQILLTTFFPDFVYSEDTELGESMGRHVLKLNGAEDAFESGSSFTDYGIVSGTKQGVSGPRCSGVEPPFASAGDSIYDISVSAKETSFDNETTGVSFACPAVHVISVNVKSETELVVTISVDDTTVDQDCDITVTTGLETIDCSFEVLGMPDTDRIVWSFKTEGAISSSPTIVGENVYFGSLDGKVYCVDASDGTLIWEYLTGDAVFSSPAVLNDRLYIGSSDKSVYCLNADNGSLVWQYATGGSVQTSPAVSEGYVYVGSYDMYLYCLDADTGNFVWKYDTQKKDLYSTPAIAKGRVYIGGEETQVYCLDAVTGTLIWEQNIGGDLQTSPALSDGFIYLGVEDDKVYCLDEETGTKVWNYATGNMILSSPAIADGRVYTASWDNKVYSLDAEDGSRFWDFETGGDVQSSPAITDKYLYIGSTDSYVYCLNAKSGLKIWGFKTGGAVNSSPAVKDGRVYVGSFDSSLYCLKAPIDDTGSWPMYQNNLERTGSEEAVCIAASVLGNTSPSTRCLRLFREQVLEGNPTGEKIISFYYWFSHRIAPVSRTNSTVRAVLEKMFEACAYATGFFVSKE